MPLEKKETVKKETIYIVDGYGFIFRAFYALPNLTAPNGTPMGAVFGFYKMLISLINSVNPSHMIIALDTGKRTFRNTIYDEYLEKKYLEEMFASDKFADCFRKANLSYEDVDKTSSNDIINRLSIDRNKINDICNKYNLDPFNPPKMLVLLVFLDVIDDIKVEDFKTQYKANRKESPDDLKKQFSIVRELIDAIGIYSVSIVGYEADDVIASIAKEATLKNYNVVVVSADKDLCQLVKDNEISVYDPTKKKLLNEAGVIEKFGVKSSQIVDYLSIVGDSSDNVHGVKGIGPKGAVKLIEKYGSIEEILSHLDEIDEKSSDKIRMSIDTIRLAKRLISLKYDAIKIEDFDKFKVNINHQTLTKFIKKYGFKNIDEHRYRHNSVDNIHSSIHSDTPEDRHNKTCNTHETHFEKKNGKMKNATKEQNIKDLFS